MLKVDWLERGDISASVVEVVRLETVALVIIGILVLVREHSDTSILTLLLT